jgi:ribose transport system ATP-binding protein
LDVGKNIYLGREPGSNIPGVIDWPKLYRQAQEQVERLGLDIDPRSLVNELTIAEQQMVEVVKALSLDASLIVMDEPTSALTERETETLFEQMVRLREQGVSIIFISHRLEEVFRVANRLTVLRDGHLVDTRPLDGLSEDEVVTMMVGRELASVGRRESQAKDEVVLQVENLHCGNMVRGVSFRLQRGEIVGLAGLVGAGRTALVEAVFGARPVSQGSVWLEGKPVAIRSPAQAIKLGMGFVPEDRKAQGLFLNMAVRQNIVMAALDGLTRLGLVRQRATQSMASALVERLDIRTPGLSQRVGNLSGGNQQKVIMARWLALEPKVLILDEPTRGIDVGAKAEIHALLGEMAASGMGVLMVSSELPEVLGVSDRVLVMRGGRVVAELDPRQATQDDVMSAAARSQRGNNNHPQPTV